MNEEVLVEAFRHSAWAMKTLIEACKSVSDKELGRPALGFGSILETLNHLVISDAAYIASLDGDRSAWLSESRDENDLEQLLARAEETADRWQRFLREPVDPERVLTLDKGAYETHAAVVIVQALHHASVHSEQVRARLTAIEVEPPDLQPWAFADETGRSRWLRPQD